MWKAYLDGNRSQRTLMLAAHVRHPEARQAILTGWPEWGIAAFQDRQDEVAAWDLEHPDKPVRPPRVPKPKAPPARPSSKPPEAEVVVKAAKSSAEKASASAELAVAAQERAVEALEVIKAAASDTEAWDTFRSKVIETADRALAQWGPMREAIAEALGEAMAAFRAGTFKRYRTVRRFDPRFPGRIQTVEEEYIDRIAVIRVMTDLRFCRIAPYRPGRRVIMGRTSIAALVLSLAGCGGLDYPTPADGGPRPEVAGTEVDAGAEEAADAMPEAATDAGAPALPLCFPQGLGGAQWFVPTTCPHKPGCGTCVWHESSAPGHTVLQVSGCVGPGDEACVTSCDQCR